MNILTRNIPELYRFAMSLALHGVLPGRCRRPARSRDWVGMVRIGAQRRDLRSGAVQEIRGSWSGSQVEKSTSGSGTSLIAGRGP